MSSKAAGATDEVRGLLLQGEPLQALACCDAALERGLAGAGDAMALARLLGEMGRWRRARRAWDQAAQLSPRDPEALAGAGLALANAGEPEQALRACDAALDLDPGLGEAHKNRGLALLRLGRLQEADQACRRARELAPDSPEALSAAALTRMSQGRPTEAEALFRHALELRPGHPGVLANLAFMLRRLGRAAEAADLLEQAVQGRPFNASALSALAASLLDASREADALQAMERAVETAPDKPALHYNHAAMLLRLDRLDQAIAAMRRTLQLAPGHPEALANLPALLSRAGRPGEAIQAARKLVEAMPGYPGGRYNLAVLLMRAGNPCEAEQQARRAAELDPAMADARLCLAQILKLQGRFAEALEHAKAGHELRPDAPSHFALGALYKRLDQPDKAVAHFTDYLRLQPHDPDGAALFLAALGEGEPPKVYPEQAVRRLFDQVAESYDQRVVRGLRYQGHKLIYQALAGRLAGLDRPRILDLGCGPGLCGAVLAPFAGVLHGVDLSPKMIEQAETLGVYDQLAAAEAAAFLRERPRSYDVVAAGDVLVYMGELDEVFAAVRRSLVPGGLFAFTLEKSVQQPVRLGLSGRFAHSGAYVDSTARASGFAVVTIEDACARFEEQEPVAGLLCLLQSEED